MFRKSRLCRSKSSDDKFSIFNFETCKIRLNFSKIRDENFKRKFLWGSLIYGVGSTYRNFQKKYILKENLFQKNRRRQMLVVHLYWFFSQNFEFMHIAYQRNFEFITNSEVLLYWYSDNIICHDYCDDGALFRIQITASSWLVVTSATCYPVDSQLSRSSVIRSVLIREWVVMIV